MIPPAGHHSCDPSRRRFLQGLSAGALMIPAIPLWGEPEAQPKADFEQEAGSLLRDWCDGLLGQQIIAPEQGTRHGAFRCPACNRLHGRCGDAILPFLTMAARTMPITAFPPACITRSSRPRRSPARCIT